MKTRNRTQIYPSHHPGDGTTLKLPEGIKDFQTSVTINVEGNEEFLNRLAWIFAQQVMQAGRKEVPSCKEVVEPGSSALDPEEEV